MDLYHITKECYENGERLFRNDLCDTEAPTEEPSKSPSMEPTTSPVMPGPSGESGAIFFEININLVVVFMILNIFGI